MLSSEPSSITEIRKDFYNLHVSAHKDSVLNGQSKASGLDSITGGPIADI